MKYTFKYYFYNEVDKHGRHEVHKEYCDYMPSEKNRTYIGEFPDCSTAIAEAKSKYPTYEFDGCFHCSRYCHRF